MNENNKPLKNAKAALLGFHGHRSTGDDALASAIGWHLYKNRGVRRYVVPAEPYDLPILPEPLGVSAPLPWLHRGRWRNKWRWSLCAKRCEILLLAGGANLHENIDYRHYMTILKIARNSKALVFGAIGVSMGPFSSQTKRDECGEFLRAMDFLTLRDRDSYEIACGYSLPYKPVDAMDAVLTLPEVYGISTTPKIELKSDALDIGVSVTPFKAMGGYGSGSAGTCLPAVIECLIRFSKRYKIRVNLFEFSGHQGDGDGPLVEAMRSELENKCDVIIHPYHRDPSRIWKTIADMDIMICTRFHASIFSYSAGVPFVMLDYHPKCAAFAQDIGLPDELKLDVYKLAPDELIDSLESLISPDRPHPTLAYSDALAKAELNFGPLYELLPG